jgi:agmatinase
MTWYGKYHKQTEEPYFLGICTFMKLPLIRSFEELKKEKCDVAIVGAPFDDGVSLRPGSRFGPRAIREACPLPSPPYERYNIEVGADPFGIFKVMDYGDVNVVPGDVMESHNRITAKVLEVLEVGAIPVVLGGDHSITFPAVRAFHEHYKGKIGVIHFDTHADTADSDFGMRYGHGTPMRRILELGRVEGRNFTQIGLRGFWPLAEFDWMRKQGMKWFLMKDVEDLGIENCAKEVVERAWDGTEAVYLTFDVDSLDPGYTPGTGTPEPGGLTSREVFRAIRIIAKAGLNGMDVVEVSPPYDVAGITSLFAFRLVLEVLSSLALRNQA